MTRSRAALFVDFDNVFGSLMAEDPTAGLLFAETPAVWLESLATTNTLLAPRSWLVRRCYINPAGFIFDPRVDAANEKERWANRLFFSKYRPYFTKAGFEVVDCPALTTRNKNAADIRIALDVNDTLTANTAYDEFVLASGDSDFTPVLVRLRAADRRTVIMSPSIVAAAYSGIADLHLDSEAIRQLLGVEADEPGPSEPSVEEVPNESAHRSEQVSAKLYALVTTLDAHLARADEPLHLSHVIPQLRSELVDHGLTEDWFGYGSFGRAMAALNHETIRFSNHYVWDSSRHEPPPGAAGLQLPPLITRLCLLVELPRVAKNDWPLVYVALADFLQQHTFELSAITRDARDKVAREGRAIGRSVFFSVCRGVLQTGVSMTRRPPLTAEEIATAFFASVLERAETAQLHLTDDEQAEVADWLSANPL